MTSVLQRAYCRIFQAGMKLANYFVGYRTPETLEGPGCVRGIPRILKEKGIDKVLVVTGNNLRRHGVPDGLFEALDTVGVGYAVFSDYEPNPTVDNVEAGLEIYQSEGCRGIVALGGGSPMDCAKAIGARAVRPDKSVTELQGLLKVGKKIPFFIAVPTTSGTGSETTVAAVITDPKTHHKASINDPALMPDVAVLDPELTAALPPFTTAITGMDALCHAVEAYTNHTYNTKLEDRMALDAVKLIYENLERAFKDGRDMVARQNMQKAAFYAGRAFTRGCVGYVHAVGHTLGGLYGMPHGQAMAMLLPKVMKQFGPAAYDRLADLAAVCGMDGTGVHEMADNFIYWIEQMNTVMGIPEKIDLIKDEDLDRMIDWAMAEGNPLYPVPEIWGRDDFRKLIDSVRA